MHIVLPGRLLTQGHVAPHYAVLDNVDDQRDGRARVRRYVQLVLDGLRLVDFARLHVLACHPSGEALRQVAVRLAREAHDGHRHVPDIVLPKDRGVQIDELAGTVRGVHNVPRVTAAMRFEIVVGDEVYHLEPGIEQRGREVDVRAVFAILPPDEEPKRLALRQRQSGTAHQRAERPRAAAHGERDYVILQLLVDVGVAKGRERAESGQQRLLAERGDPETNALA